MCTAQAEVEQASRGKNQQAMYQSMQQQQCIRRGIEWDLYMQYNKREMVRVTKAANHQTPKDDWALEVNEAWSFFQQGKVPFQGPFSNPAWQANHMVAAWQDAGLE